jgi:hypothetical protein
MGRSIDQKGAALPRGDGRIEENTAAVVVDFDDEIHRPGSISDKGRRGEKMRGSRASYRRNDASNEGRDRQNEGKEST